MNFFKNFLNKTEPKKDKPISKHLSIPKTTGFYTILDLNPTNIRHTVKYGSNTKKQNMISTLMKTDSHFIGKIQDRLSIINKTQMNWIPASDDKKDVEICDFVRESLTPVLTQNILQHFLLFFLTYKPPFIFYLKLF